MTQPLFDTNTAAVSCFFSRSDAKVIIRSRDVFVFGISHCTHSTSHAVHHIIVASHLLFEISPSYFRPVSLDDARFMKPRAPIASAVANRRSTNGSADHFLTRQPDSNARCPGRNGHSRKTIMTK